MADFALKTYKEKLAALTAGVVAATCFLGWNFVARPQLAKVEQVRAEHGDDRGRRELIAKIAEAEKRVAAFKNRLPERAETAWVTEILNQLGDESGVSLLSVTPVSREPFDGYYRLPVRIDVECDWRQLVDFAGRIEAAPRRIKVNALHVDGARTADDKPVRLRASMTVSALHPAGELVS